MERLYLFLKAIFEVRFNNEHRLNISDDDLKKLLLDDNQMKLVIRENAGLVEDAINSELTSKEIIHYGYRKKQLLIFDNILRSNDEFDSFQASVKKEGVKVRGKESVWQFFLEKNTWILGYGLQYIFNTGLSDKKLEQVTSGATFNSRGKRTDAFLKSRGMINSLCFCEIKLPGDFLLKQVTLPYRGESWQVSDALSGAIAQVQRTVHKAIQDIKTKTEIKDQSDNLTGEKLYLYSPKAFILIGNLNEFKVDNRINEIKYSSFELFRKSLKGIEIITYDELYERAVFICKDKQ